jgi:hypothetical protein
MIKAQFTDNIAEVNGKIVRNVIATWPATRSHGCGSVSVFREFEDGKKQVRKLCYVPIGGYMIDDREPSTWCNPVLECRALSRGENVYGSYLTDSEVETIINEVPKEEIRHFNEQVPPEQPKFEQPKVEQPQPAYGQQQSWQERYQQQRPQYGQQQFDQQPGQMMQGYPYDGE